VQALFDEGALVRNGAVKVVRSLSQIRLPSTVQGILASRIDRLPTEHKQLLQSLAVIGRESPIEMIRHVASLSRSQVEQVLLDLQRRELIYEQPSTDGVSYIFKHVLTQEVAYNAILAERRKMLHERTAQAIEDPFGLSLADHYSELAHHYSRSSNVEKAISYLQLAGEQSVERSANTEAIAFFEAALEMLKARQSTGERSLRELALQLALGPALQAAKGWAAPEVERTYARAFVVSGSRGKP
jgi:predicted ATPase